MTTLILGVFLALLGLAAAVVNLAEGPLPGPVAASVLIFLLGFLGLGLLVSALVLRAADAAENKGGASRWF